MRWSWHARAVVVVCALVSIAGPCDKPDWLAEFERRLDSAVPRLEAALDKLAQDLPRLAGLVDQAAADEVALLNRLLRENVDGINQILTENRERLDAALVARVEQLARFAEQLAAQVSQMANGLLARITLSVNELVAQTELTSRALLTSMDLQIARVRDEGGRTVAQVYSGSQDLTVRIAGGIMVILALGFGGAFFVINLRRKAGRSWIVQTIVAVVVLTAGLLLLFSSGLRSKFFARDLIVQRNTCPSALRDADEWMVKHARVTPLPPEAVTSAPQIMSALLACEAVASARPQYDLAVDRVAQVRRALGITKPCASDGECPGGHWCNALTSSCTNQCRIDDQCAAGLLCHPDGGVCRAPCGPASACPAGGACDANGRCVAAAVAVAPGGRHIKGGIGWDRAAACGEDMVCLRTNPHLRALLGP
jgi:hypothetical protein